MMNLDRLILRINAVLDGYAEGFEARALASDYAAISENVRERLRQCVALIKAGNDNAALQVAEASPPVLDIAAKLAFDRSDKWREYCRANRLALPHRMEPNLVDAVNGLYAKEIGESHPLYRDYRAAVRERDETKALGVLRSIVRINANDKNAREEFERLSAKLRRVGLAELKEALEHKRDGDVIGILTKMEASGLAPCPDSPVWTEAEHQREHWEKQRVLLEALGYIPDIIRIRDLGEWENTIPLLGKIRSLEKQYGFQWPPKDAKLIADIEAWVGGHAAAAEKVRREADHLEDLHKRLDELEHRTAGPDRPKALVEGDIAAVDAWLKEADELPEKELFHNPIHRAQRVRSKLKGVLHRRRNRLVAVYLSSAATLALLGLAGYHFAKVAESERTFHDGLSAAEKSAAVKPVHEFLEGPAKAAPALAAEPANADRIQKLRTRALTAGRALTQVLDEAAAVSRDCASGSPVSGLKTRLATLSAALDTLAPDLREEAARAVADAEGAVKTRESAEAAKAEERVSTAVDALEKLLGDTGSSREAIDDAAGKLSSALEGAPPSEATLERAKAALAKAGRSSKSLGDAVAAREQLKSAKDLPGYLAAISALAASGSEAPDARAAARIASSSDALSRLPEGILTSDAAQMAKGLAALGEGKRFIPAEPTAIETGKASTLARISKFADVWRATKTTFYADGTTLDARIYLKNKPVTENLPLNGGAEVRTEGEQFGPSGTVEKLLVVMRKFDGRTPNGARLDAIAPAPEAGLIPDIARLYDTDRGTFTLAPIEMLDRLLASDASPLFKAWVHQEILRIAEERPEAWGFAFSPEAKRDGLRLKGLLPVPVDHLAWLTPDKFSRLNGQLSSFYAEKRVPYRPAAEARLALVRGVMKSGAVFVGQTDLEGRPAEGAALGEPGTRLFGLNAEGTPSVLGEVDAAGAYVAVKPAAPLSPLLRLGTNPAKIAPPPAELPAPGGDWNNLFFSKR